jgi:hypothetical protein
VATGCIAAECVRSPAPSDFCLQWLHPSLGVASRMSSSDSVIDFIEDAEVASLDDRDCMLEPDIEDLEEYWLWSQTASWEWERRREDCCVESLLLSEANGDDWVRKSMELSAFLASNSRSNDGSWFLSSSEDTERLLLRPVCGFVYVFITEASGDLKHDALFSDLETTRAVLLISADRRHCA